MRSMVSSRELAKWSAIAVKGVLAILAVLPTVKEMLENQQSGSLYQRRSGSASGGQFELLLLDEHGKVITTRKFARHEVNGGFVNVDVVQQAALAVRAVAAILAYQSSVGSVNSPTVHREVVRQVFAALAAINVKLVSRSEMKADG